MKCLQVSVLVICALLVSDVASEKIRKRKKFHHKTESKEVKDEKKIEAPPALAGDIDNIPIIDPCLNVHCGAGSVCETDAEGEPQCVCIPQCPVEVEDRRQVCSNHNETWTSDCAIYQHRCLCKKGDPQCKGEQYKHVHIEYYGACRNMRECSKDEMADFPRRMRDWLFNIMRDLADRQELNKNFMKMEREAENNMTRRWANAAIWKFCELDGNPPDRSISRHELFPIRAPLMALEHCIAPFLDKCDMDNNHRINLKEWAVCLELEEA
ncbi:SPARC [Aethina tumida]|uniref:SPARC n=1 Tax=Aethina tumida TaxID=116153 RepID=UPI002149855C|nr:SPARC [Aethina tumida]